MVDIIGDNFNRKVGNDRWGKAVQIDVFHIAGLLRQVRAPLSLSRTNPEVLLSNLKGETGGQLYN